MSKAKVKYDVAYFLNKFERIPGKKWTTGEFKNNSGQCCALGHCQDAMGNNTDEYRALNTIFYKARRIFGDGDVVDVNDANSDVIPGIKKLGSTPKTRVINALTLIGAGVQRYLK